MIGVDDHRKQELETLGDYLSEASFRYRFLVLLEQVLKTFVEHNLDLIHLEQLDVLAEELVKRLVEGFYRDLLRLSFEFGLPEVLYHELLIGHWLGPQSSGQEELGVEHPLMAMLLGAGVE